MNETRWPGAGAAVFLGGVLKLRDTGGWSHLLPTVFEEVCGGGGGGGMMTKSATRAQVGMSGREQACPCLRVALAVGRSGGVRPTG